MGRALALVCAGIFAVLIGVGALAACAPSFAARAYSTALQDNRRFEPFEMAPGLYYVGSSNIAVYALTTSEGIILIDGGYTETAQQVLANFQTLGLDPQDVRVLLNTHAHMDHAAGLAELKRVTGARLFASPASADELERGGRDDFFLGDLMAYEAMQVDRRLRDGEVVTLGERSLTAHFTPGHTRGCTTWTFPIEVDGAPRQALINCSLSTLRYRLVNNAAYPEIAADYQRTYAIMRGLPCEFFLGAHGSYYDLARKRRAQRAGASANPFLDPEGCADFVDRQERRFRAELARQSN